MIVPCKKRNRNQLPSRIITDVLVVKKSLRSKPTKRVSLCLLPVKIRSTPFSHSNAFRTQKRFNLARDADMGQAQVSALGFHLCWLAVYTEWHKKNGNVWKTQQKLKKSKKKNWQKF